MKAFCYDRDYQQLHVIAILENISWPAEIDVAWMQAAQREVNIARDFIDEQIEKYYRECEREAEEIERDEYLRSLDDDLTYDD